MKPQRNKPCPCGSGKKYKKCCYSKDVEEQNAKRYPERKPMTDEERKKFNLRMAAYMGVAASGWIP